MLETNSFAAYNSHDDLKPYEFKRRDILPDDIEIEIDYCGVCHSDIHMVKNDWGMSNYPLVPGHEIIGRVRSFGSKVSDFKIGDLVGVGCMVDSCRECS